MKKKDKQAIEEAVEDVSQPIELEEHHQEIIRESTYEEPKEVQVEQEEPARTEYEHHSSYKIEKPSEQEYTPEQKEEKEEAAPLDDPVTEAKAKIADYHGQLPLKGDPEREKKKKLL